MVIALWIVCIPVVLLLAGAVYQHLGSRRDRKRFTGSGRWVSVGRGCDLSLRDGRRPTHRRL